MPIYVRFFVYKTANRHEFRYLQADQEVTSLDEFNYGQSLWLTEHIEGSRATAYVVADLPVKRQATNLVPAGQPGFDIYLASAEQWGDFARSSSSAIDLPYGPSL